MMWERNRRWGLSFSFNSDPIKTPNSSCAKTITYQRGNKTYFLSLNKEHLGKYEEVLIQIINILIR